MTNSLLLPSLPRFPDLSGISKASGCWLATIGVGLAIGLPIGAAADPLDADSDEAPRPAWARWLDPNAEQPPGMGENVYYKKGTGLEYRRETKLGESPVEVGVQGPLLKKKKDPSGFAEPGGRQRRMSGVGLTVEVRF